MIGLLRLLDLANKVLDLWSRAVQAFKSAKVKAWSKEFREHSEQVENAQTDEDRRKLARAGSDLMRKPESDGS